MRGLAIAAWIAIPLCACGGVRSSNIKVGLGEQPVYPLHVHPSLSGSPALANARAPGRGTRGSPTSPPWVVTDYPDPPEAAMGSADGPDALATGQPTQKPRRSRRQAP